MKRRDFISGIAGATAVTALSTCGKDEQSSSATSNQPVKPLKQCIGKWLLPGQKFFLA